MTGLVGSEGSAQQTSQSHLACPEVAPKAPSLGAVGFTEMSGGFSAAATDILALDTADALSAHATHVLTATKDAAAVFLCRV